MSFDSFLVIISLILLFFLGLNIYKKVTRDRQKIRM